MLPLPPGPRPIIPGKIFRELRKGPLEFFTRIVQTYGDVSSFKVVGTRYVVINHPDLAREVLLTQADAFWKGPALQNSKGILGEGLLTAEGDTHRSQRKLMVPAFHAKHVETYAQTVIDCTQDLLTTWQTRPQQQSPRDIRPGLMGLTLIIAGSALFGSGITPDDIATVHRCMDDLMNNYVRSVVPWGKLLNRIPIPSTLKLARAQRDLRSLVEGLIAQRRAELKAIPSGKGDLLSMMISATDDTSWQGRPANDPPACPHRAAEVSPLNPTRLTDEQLRDQSITILTAGHETTANALTFTLYLLAKHPLEQEKLRKEILQTLGHAMPSVDALDNLTRTRWVLSESMRLLPPAWTLGRQNQREVELGGFRLPAKSTVLIPQWTLHRDPRFFPDPLTFNPDRWQNPTHPRHAYLPFSTGPRNCIGESFAWVEMMLVLPMLIRDFHFTVPPNAPDLKLIPAITLRPRGGVPLVITPSR